MYCRGSVEWGVQRANKYLVRTQLSVFSATPYATWRYVECGTADIVIGMSILARLHDAQLLYEHGRLDGALLSLLVAVAATSRRRYPSKKLKDGEVFCKFVREEMGALIGSICNNSIPGLQITFKGKHLSIEKILYKYLRCELAHQAKSVKEIVFIEHPSCLIWLNGHELILNQAFLQGFANICHSAAENADLANEPLDRPAAQLPGEPCGILVNILSKPFNFRKYVKWSRPLVAG